MVRLEVLALEIALIPANTIKVDEEDPPTVPVKVLSGKSWRLPVPVCYIYRKATERREKPDRAPRGPP